MFGCAHDLHLLLVACIVGFGVSVLACTLFDRSFRSDRSARMLWQAATAMTAGTGYWATHFILLLALRPGLPVGFDPVLTLSAWATSILALGLAGRLLSSWTSWGMRLSGGLALAFSQIAVHYLAMSAFRTEGLLRYSAPWVIGSIAAPILIIASLSLFTAKLITWRSRLRTGAILTFSLLVAHFIGVAGVDIAPDLRIAIPGNAISPAALSVGVVALLTMAVTMAILPLVIHWKDNTRAFNRLKEVIEAMPAGLAYYDANDRAMFWNSRYAVQGGPCAELLRPGISFRELIRAGIDAGLYPEAQGFEERWLDERVEQHRKVRTAFEHQDGESWLRVDERRTREGGVISVTMDITDLKRTAQSLEIALHEAQAANRAKDAFLANMSHELRTPLNGVLGLSDVLARTALQPAQAQLVRTIQASASSLERLLSDVLDVARGERREIELRPVVFEVEELVSETVALFQPKAIAKGLLMTASVGAQACRLCGDAGRIKHILSHLLDNAIKFTPTGSIHLRVAVNEDQDRGRLTLQVRDTGIGFEPEAAEMLFSRFQQADGSITRAAGGMGLGLSISRELARLMGGDITAHSSPGRGAVFEVTLLLEQAGTDPGVALGEPCEAAAPGLRVLLADDHPTNREVVCLILSRFDMELKAVENGAQAVEAFQAAPFDLVLMDLQMPVMDGLTAIRTIRAFEQSHARHRTPMIALTANVLPEHVAASLDAGATCHLGKPVTAALLLDGINDALSKEESMAFAAE